jgi:hypothetical protein
LFRRRESQLSLEVILSLGRHSESVDRTNGLVDGTRLLRNVAPPAGSPVHPTYRRREAGTSTPGRGGVTR